MALTKEQREEIGARLKGVREVTTPTGQRESIEDRFKRLTTKKDIETEREDQAEEQKDELSKEEKKQAVDFITSQGSNAGKFGKFFSQLVSGESPDAFKAEGWDPLRFPKMASSLALETGKGLTRLGARPFVETVRGVRELVPGGKTGEEPISVPFLGEFEEPTLGKSLLEAGEATISMVPVTKLFKPIINVAKKFKPAIKTVDDAIDSLIGKITQGKPSDIKKVTEALKTVDTTDIKTYQELKDASRGSIQSLSKAQDKLLSGFDEAVDVNKFSKELAGEERNHIKTAFNNLEEHYRKANDLESLDDLLKLKDKVDSKGITLNEINALARKYSSDMPKAFTTAGEPSTSVTKQSLENTRKGLKDLFRNELPDNIKKQSIALDDQVSSLFKLEELTTKMTNKSQQLYNKIEERGLVEALSRQVGRGVNMATFGGIRGFLTSFLPSNIGNKVLNSVDLEKQLAKNLTKLDNLLNMSISDEKLLTEMQQLILQNIGKEAITQ